MLDRLEAVAARYDEINHKLMEPNVTNDQELYTSLMKEYKRLTPIVEKYQEYRQAKQSFEEAREMLGEGGLDKELRELAQEQLDASRDQIETAS